MILFSVLNQTLLYNIKLFTRIMFLFCPKMLQGQLFGDSERPIWVLYFVWIVHWSEICAICHNPDHFYWWNCSPQWNSELQFLLESILYISCLCRQSFPKKIPLLKNFTINRFSRHFCAKIIRYLCWDEISSLKQWSNC